MRTSSCYFPVRILIALALFSSCQSNDQATKSTSTEIVQDTAAKAIPEEVTPALGIDVSHFQGDINWEEIKANNISFAYSKATEGKAYADPRFSKNWSEMLAAKITRGAYHFYNTESEGAVQAQHYINTVKTLNKGDLPPVLDVEQGGVVGDVKIADFQKQVKIWLSKVEDEFGVQPIIYTNTPFANEYLNEPYFAKYTLWIAEYGVKEPRIPNTWKTVGWSIWQRSQSGNVLGENGNVDHDITKGNLKDLVIQ